MALAEVDARRDTDGPGGGASPQQPPEPGEVRVALLAGAVPALLTLAVCFYVLHLPNVLYGTHEYDDGVYMGAALRFVQGIIPYRDFVIVHPPGIVLLMAPFALLGQVFGSGTSMALARDLTALVAAANVVLCAVAVRHRGWKAAAVAATALACFPMAPAADSTLLLEPYLMFFSLLGLVLMFRGGRLAGPRRVLLAGLAFGFGGAVKIWGAFLVLAVAVVCLRRVKSALLPLLVGSALGFALPCLPFFLMAPRAFLTDIIGDQFQRVASGTAVLSWSERVLVLSGLPGMTLFAPSAALAVVVAAGLIVAVCTVVAIRRHQMLAADWAVLSGTVGAILPMWVASDIYPHYIYFTAPLVAMLLGLTVSLVRGRRRSPAPELLVAKRRWSPFPVMAANRTAVAGIVALAAVAAFQLPQEAGYARSSLKTADNSNFLNILIAPGECVVSDDTSVLVTADLFGPPPAHCPNIIDAYGTFLASWPGHEPPSLSMGRVPIRTLQQGTPPASFVNEWAGWLSRADWVLQLSQISSYIPWTPALRAWFAEDFKLAIGDRGLWVYKHVLRTPPPVDR